MKPMILRTGKLAPARDPRTFRLAKYLTGILPTPPAEVSYYDRVPIWGMYANDQFGDCVLAAAAHMEKLWGALDGKPVNPTQRSILALYHRLSPDDQGLVLMDILRLWRKVGICRHKIDAFAAMDLGNENHIKLALWMFGGAFIGLNLPLSAQDQVGKVWDVVSTGHSKPGSWGGHGVNATGFNEIGPECVTWNAKQQMTWAFWHAYCDEAYAVLPAAYSTAPKSTGIDFTLLQQDLALIGSVK